MTSNSCERVYLFRGKSRETDRWIFGNLNIVGDFYYILSQDIMGCIGVSDLGEEIDPDTASQYIMGEDRNGMRLFEGDIVHVYDRHAGEYDEPIRTSVVISKEVLMWHGGGHWKPQDTVMLEVVGTIWDNFEMLEESERRWVDNYFRVKIGDGREED